MVRNFVESYHGGDIPHSTKTVQVDGLLPKIVFETDRYVQPSEPEEYILGIDGKIVLVGEDESEVVAGKLQILLVLIEWHASTVLPLSMPERSGPAGPARTARQTPDGR
jgi:hypothetical protein